MKAKPKRRTERIPLRVVKGGFEPANATAQAQLKSRRYKVGDIVFSELKKPRNPGYHRLAHRLGTLAVQNLDGFESMNAHSVLKRLQVESGVGCEQISIQIGGGMVPVNIPLSLSYEQMEQGEFEQIYTGLCHYLAQNYWEGLTAEQVKEMADAMPDTN